MRMRVLVPLARVVATLAIVLNLAGVATLSAVSAAPSRTVDLASLLQESVATPADEQLPDDGGDTGDGLDGTDVGESDATDALDPLPTDDATDGSDEVPGDAVDGEGAVADGTDTSEPVDEGVSEDVPVEEIEDDASAPAQGPENIQARDISIMAVGQPANGTFNLNSVTQSGDPLSGACYTYTVGVSTDLSGVIEYLTTQLLGIVGVDQVLAGILNGTVTPLLNEVLDPIVATLTTTLFDSCNGPTLTGLLNDALGSATNLVNDILRTPILLTTIGGLLGTDGQTGLLNAVLSAVVITPTGVTTVTPPAGYENDSYLSFDSTSFSLADYAGSSVTRNVVWADEPAATDTDTTDTDDGDTTDADTTDNDGSDGGEPGTGDAATLTILKVDTDGLPLVGACFDLNGMILSGPTLSALMAALGLDVLGLNLVSAGCDSDDGDADGTIVLQGLVPELLAAVQDVLDNQITGPLVRSLLGGVQVDLTLTETVLPEGALNPGPLNVQITLLELLSGEPISVTNQVAGSDSDTTDTDTTDTDTTDADASDDGSDGTDTDGGEPGTNDGASLTILKVDTDGLPLLGACFDLDGTLVSNSTLSTLLAALGLNALNLNLVSVGCDADDGDLDGTIVLRGLVPDLAVAVQDALLDPLLSPIVSPLLNGIQINLTLTETVLPTGALNPGPLTSSITLLELLNGDEITVENQLAGTDTTDADATDTDADTTDTDATDTDTVDDGADADAADGDATDADTTDDGGDGGEPGVDGASLTILKVDTDGLPLVGACFDVDGTLIGSGALLGLLTALGLDLGDLDLISAGCDEEDGDLDGTIVLRGLVPELVVAVQNALLDPILGPIVSPLLGGIQIDLTLTETVLPEGALNPGPISTSITLLQLIRGGQVQVVNEVDGSDGADASDADTTDVDTADADSTDTDTDTTDADTTDADGSDADADAGDADTTDADTTDADVADADATDADTADTTDADATDIDAADVDTADADTTDTDATDTDTDAVDTDAVDADTTDADAVDVDATDTDATDTDGDDGAETEQGTLTLYVLSCDNLDEASFSALATGDEPTDDPDCEPGTATFTITPMVSGSSSSTRLASTSSGLTLYSVGSGATVQNAVAMQVAGTEVTIADTGNLLLDADRYQIVEPDSGASAIFDMTSGGAVSLVFQEPAAQTDAGDAADTDTSDGAETPGQPGEGPAGKPGKDNGKVTTLPTTGAGDDGAGFGSIAMILVAGAVALSAIGLQAVRRSER